jgi:hypothetical protein
VGEADRRTGVAFESVGRRYEVNETIIFIECKSGKYYVYGKG